MHPRIRTYHGRHGRVTPRMRSLLDELGPGRGLDARADADRPLVLEVGCGHGESALSFAAAHPTVDVLGTEVHTPGIVTLLAEAEARRATNVFVMRADAVDLLDHRLATGSLQELHLFFPDPWPKARHHKRRFVRPDVLDLLADRLRHGGAVRVATDVDDYARWASGHLDRHAGFQGGVAPRPAWRPVTRYEAAANAGGRRVVELVYRRR